MMRMRYSTDTVMQAVYVFMLFVIVVLVFTVYLVGSPRKDSGEQKPMEVLDARYDDHLKLSLKAHEPFDLEDCRLSVSEEEGVVHLSPRMGDRRFYTFRSHQMNLSVHEQEIDKALSPRPVRIADIGGDAAVERLAVCSENNCPARYEGTHLVLRLSGAESPQYLPLRGREGGLVNLAQAPVELDVHMAQAADHYWLTAEGTTSSLPYTLGMGDVRVSITYAPVQVPEDLDEDGQTDYVVANSDGIHWVLSGTDEVLRTRWLNESVGAVTGEEGRLATLTDVENSSGENNTEYRFRLVPAQHKQGKFWVEPLIQHGEGDDGMVNTDELVRFHASVGRDLQRIRVACTNASVDIHRREVKALS